MTETFTPCGYIDDGYTQDFSIPEVPGVHVGLDGKYRPMTNREINNFVASLDASKYSVKRAGNKDLTVEDQIDAKSMALLADHIVEWSLSKPNGDSVLISPSSVSRINPPMLAGKLIDVLTGVSKTMPASDVRNITLQTDLTVDQKLEKIRPILEALEEQQQGDDLKN